MNREEWLTAATVALEPILRNADLGLVDVRVSCGWPARGALARTKRRVGECWHGSMNGDGKGHIFVSPCADKPIEVLGILLHELAHAALPAKTKHNRTFAAAARRMGLDGKPTATTVGEGLGKRLHADILPTLGPYPHQAIDTSLRPKQGTRMRLYECTCPVKVRVASDAFAATCDACGEHFTRR